MAKTLLEKEYEKMTPGQWKSTTPPALKKQKEKEWTKLSEMMKKKGKKK